MKTKYIVSNYTLSIYCVILVAFSRTNISSRVLTTMRSLKSVLGNYNRTTIIVTLVSVCVEKSTFTDHITCSVAVTASCIVTRRPMPRLTRTSRTMGIIIVLIINTRHFCSVCSLEHSDGETDGDRLIDWDKFDRGGIVGRCCDERSGMWRCS